MATKVMEGLTRKEFLEASEKEAEFMLSCKVPSCGLKSWAKGMCRKHYDQARRLYKL